MSCGCKIPKELLGAAKGYRNLVRARAVSCHLCPHGIRDSKQPWSKGVLRCGISGAEITMLVNGREPCPKGRFPDENGIVRRWGIRHYGIPFIERLVMKFHKRHPAICAAYAGCGCIVRLKDLFARIPGLRRLTICKARA